MLERHLSSNSWRDDLYYSQHCDDYGNSCAGYFSGPRQQHSDLQRGSTGTGAREGQEPSLPGVGGQTWGRRASKQSAAGRTSVPAAEEEPSLQGEGRGVSTDAEAEVDDDQETLVSEAWLDGAPDTGTKTAAGSGVVASRVRQLEQRKADDVAKAQTQKSFAKRPMTNHAGKPIGGPNSVPVIHPLHVNKFQRRTGMGTPMRPETPLYRATPEDDAVLHAPQPTKNIGILQQQDRVPVQTPRLRDVASSPALTKAPHNFQTPPDTIDGALHYHDDTRARTRNRRGQALVSPAAYLHGTRDKCVRHGRKPNLKETRSMRDMVRGRNGAYHPTGMMEMRNVEATSEHAVQRDRGLTNSQGTKPDACPDCVAELGYKRREAIQTVMRPEHTSTETSEGHLRTVSRRSRHGSLSHEHRIRDVSRDMSHTSHHYLPWFPGHGHSASRESHEPHERQHTGSARSPTNDDLVVAEDLGPGLDAAIFERSGDLERVILNRRLGKKSKDTLHKLSKDLLSVSHALAAAGHASNRLVTHQQPAQRAAVFDSPRCARGSREKHSVPELLSLIDDAVVTIRRDRGQASDDSDHPPGEKLVHHQRFHDDQGLDRFSDHSRADVQDIDSPAYPTKQPVKKDPVPKITATSPSHYLSPPTAVNFGPESPRLIATPDLTPSLMNSPTPMTATQPDLNPFHLGLPDIAKKAAPYFHAPSQPASLLFGAWPDKQVQQMQADVKRSLQEAGQVLLNGFRVDRQETLKEAERVGRDAGVLQQQLEKI